MRLYLVGFMGAGKTAVGRCLAEHLGYRSIDLDEEIEACSGRTIPEIFERDGEPVFRDLEHACLRDTVRWDDTVVSTGGGTVLFERNAALIRRWGVSVWLNPSFATIVDRIGAVGKRDRPLFETEEQALALFRARLPAYRRADVEITVGPTETPSEVAARIALRFRERS